MNSQLLTTDVLKHGISETLINSTIDLLTNPYYVADNLVLAVSRKNTEADNVLKKGLFNLDLIMKVFIADPDGMIISAKVTKEMLETVLIDEKDAWDFAIEHSRQSAYICDIMDFFPFPVRHDNGTSIFVGTCNKGHSGASILFYPDIFKDFCSANKIEKLYILPSSTEEVVIIPWSNVFDVDELACMVHSINETEVTPELRLDPAVYFYTVETNEIKVATIL